MNDYIAGHLANGLDRLSNKAGVDSTFGSNMSSLASSMSSSNDKHIKMSRILEDVSDQFHNNIYNSDNKLT